MRVRADDAAGAVLRARALPAQVRASSRVRPAHLPAPVLLGRLPAVRGGESRTARRPHRGAPAHPLHPLCIPLQVCNRWLRCKNHRCAAPCHSGTCPPCPLTAVIACACGSARYRVPCGRERTALPPRCDKLCSMPALCRHAQQLHDQPHTCHYGPCPPCPLACGTQVRWGCVDGPTSLACHPVTHAPLCPRSAHVATHARRLATTRCHPLCPSTSRHRLQTPCSRTGAPPGPLPAAVRSSRSLQRHLLPLQQLGMLVVHAAPARRARWQ